MGGRDDQNPLIYIYICIYCIESYSVNSLNGVLCGIFQVVFSGLLRGILGVKTLAHSYRGLHVGFGMQAPH